MTRIILEGKEVDIIGELDVEFTYSIADIKEIDKRNTSFSKTIILPNTPNNAEIFGYIFDIAVETEYDPLLKNIGYNFNAGKIAKCNIYKDNVIIFNGVLRLIEIVIKNGEITYECNVFGKLRDILYRLKESFIDELDWSDTIARHDLNFKKDIMQFKYLWGDGGNPAGEFAYPLVDYGKVADWEEINQINILPQVFVREVIKRIFDFAEFTFDCPFFDTNYFKRLLLITGSGKDEYLRTQWLAVRHSSLVGNNSCGAQLRPVIISTNDLGAATEFTVGNIFGGSAIRFNTSEVLNIRWKDTWGISLANLRCQTYQVIYNIYRHVAGSGTASGMGQVQKVFTNPNPGVYPWSITFEPLDIDIPITINQQSPANEWYFVQITIQPSGAGTSGGCQIGGAVAYNIANSFNGGVYYSPTPIPSPVNRKPVPISTYMQHIKCTDFLKSIILMHNLFIETNPLNDTQLIITPYPLYYDDFKVNADDWTYLLDQSGEVTITPLSELTNFEYVFSYDDDNDYWTEVYKRRWNTNYGSAVITIDNDFLPEQKKYKVVFAPPIMITNYSKTMIHMYKVDLNTGQKKPDNFKARIAVINFVLMPDGETWNLLENPTTGWVFPFYQYAGHLDNPVNPLYDILFAPPQEIYFQTEGLYTNSNLYSVYWEVLINRISDHNSRLLTAYFYLTPNIIQNLDFARLIKVGNHYFILISVENYNPNGDGLAKVKLFKIKENLIQQDYNFILQEDWNKILQENNSRIYQ